MKRFGVMLDMSRNGIMKPEEVKKYAATIKKLGYNMIQLYTEDTYEVPGEPYFGYLRGIFQRGVDAFNIAAGIVIGIENAILHRSGKYRRSISHDHFNRRHSLRTTGN